MLRHAICDNDTIAGGSAGDVSQQKRDKPRRVTVCTDATVISVCSMLFVIRMHDWVHDCRKV